MQNFKQFWGFILVIIITPQKRKIYSLSLAAVIMAEKKSLKWVSGHFDRERFLENAAGKSTVTLPLPQHSASSKASDNDRPATHQASHCFYGERLRQTGTWGSGHSACLASTEADDIVESIKPLESGSDGYFCTESGAARLIWSHICVLQTSIKLRKRCQEVKFSQYKKKQKGGLTLLLFDFRIVQSNIFGKKYLCN